MSWSRSGVGTTEDLLGPNPLWHPSPTIPFSWGGFRIQKVLSSMLYRRIVWYHICQCHTEKDQRPVEKGMLNSIAGLESFMHSSFPQSCLFFELSCKYLFFFFKLIIHLCHCLNDILSLSDLLEKHSNTQRYWIGLRKLLRHWYTEFIS